MTYTISQLAERFSLEPYTLRFYEKEGILTPGRTAAGIRQYTEEDAAQLETLLCLKSTGMPLKDIRAYFDLVRQGDGTLSQRLEMFTRHQDHVQEEILRLQKNQRKIQQAIQWYREALEKTGG